MHPLDHPAWDSLSGTHAAIAVRSGNAARYPTDVAILAGYDPTTDGAGLAGLLGSRGVGLLIGQPVPVGCTEIGGGDAHQMVLDGSGSIDIEPPHGLAELGEADWPDMAALVAATDPGPWAPRTPLLGTYIGVRRAGALVALAGERTRPTGYAEISAVCTDPAARRLGLASALVADLARRIQARGEVPFLHVHVDNHAARPVYEKLGFVHRRFIRFSAVRPGAT